VSLARSNLGQDMIPDTLPRLVLGTKISYLIEYDHTVQPCVAMNLVIVFQLSDRIPIKLRAVT
jgi:hypothetical protein